MAPGHAVSPRGASRFRDRINDLDADRFVGRADVLRPLSQKLAGGDEGDLVLVHGAGGIGKSALLREVARRAREANRPVYAIDGRLILSSLDALRDALAPAQDDEQPVVVIDSFERMATLAASLRDEILPAMPDTAIIVIAGRQSPDAMWFRDGWEHLAREVKLRPLTDAESIELLGRLGVTGPSADETRRWAKGSPLALHIGGVNPEPDSRSLGGQGLEETIVHRLLGTEIHDVDPEVVAIAAVAGAVDLPLLVEVMQLGDPKAGFRQLRSLSVVEPIGARHTMHDLVRAALRSDLRTRDPVGYRQLVCRIADHLCERALSGEPALVADLAELIESDAMQWDVNARYRTDRLRAGDVDDVTAALHPTNDAWWGDARRYFEEAPECVTVVRGDSGRLIGFTIATTPDDAPAWTSEDPVLGPWLAHARAHVPERRAIVWRDAINLTKRPDGSEDPDVVALLNVPAHLQHRLPVAQAFYGVVRADDIELQTISASVGAVHAPELDVTSAGRALQCHIMTHGPRGIVGQLQQLIHMEQDIPLSLRSTRPVSDQLARRVLRDFHDPIALAASALAEGTDSDERAEQVRQVVRRAFDRAFGSAPGEHLLRQLVERSYLDPSGGHQRAMAESNLSRTSYYRHLADAVHRIALALAERPLESSA